MRRFAPQLLPFVALGCAACAACNPGESPAIASASSPTAPAIPAGITAPPIAKGIPHGGMINEIAITESADAALTVDNMGNVRLWPTLDGTRPPVPVNANAPKQLALAHAGHDLLAVILDDAGTVHALRLGLDGSVHGRASLPGPYVQALALESGILVRTADHAIEWYAP